jgi:hypothetical protein
LISWRSSPAGIIGNFLNNHWTRDVAQLRVQSMKLLNKRESPLGDKLGSARGFDGDPAALPDAERQMV